MARKPVFRKEEWVFFLDENGQMKYCNKCLGCTKDCKQSFRARVIYCPKYTPKRGKSNDEKQ